MELTSFLRERRALEFGCQIQKRMGVYIGFENVVPNKLGATLQSWVKRKGWMAWKGRESLDFGALCQYLNPKKGALF